jgi:DHA2 family metal-tetracycline-proton antiporter-like MFS transporter
MHKLNKSQAILVASMCFIIFFSVLNGTMFNVALPKLAKEFALTPSGVSWVIVAYSLLFAVGSVTYGKLADLFPVIRLILIGLCLFASGSVIGFFSEYYWMVLMARMIQAIGAAAIPALVMVAVTRYFPSEQRGYVMGFVASTVAFGFGVGPLLGGIISQFLEWRMLFLLSVISLLALPVLIRSLPQEQPKGGSFDYIGALLFSGGVAALLIGVNTNLWFLPAAVVFFGIFAIHIRYKEQPFIQMHLFQNRSFRILLLFGFCIFFAHMSAFFILPLMLEEVNGLESGTIGLAFFPGAMLAAILSTRAGKLSDRYGSPVVIRWSVLMMGLGFLSISLLVGVSVVWISLAVVFTFLGFSSIQASLASFIASTLEPQETGVGMGLYNLTAFMGGAFGPTIFSVFLEMDSGHWNLLNHSQAYSFSNSALILGVLVLLTLFVLASSKHRIQNASSGEQLSS